MSKVANPKQHSFRLQVTKVPSGRDPLHEFRIDLTYSVSVFCANPDDTPSDGELAEAIVGYIVKNGLNGMVLHG